jgi:hypothetical protein
MIFKVLSIALVVSLATACGETKDEPAAGSGGESGSASGGQGGGGGNAGVGGDGGSGTGGVGGAGIGGMQSDAGPMNGGTSGGGPFPDGHVGRDPDLRVDRTLGGFNQDLAEPSGECELLEELTAQCMKVSGIYNDVPFDLVATCRPAFVHLDGGYRVHGCDFDMGGGDVMMIGSRIGMMTAPTAPSVFDFQGSLGGDVDVIVERPSRMLRSHDDEPTITATHDAELRYAGELWFYQSWDGGPRHESVAASFALNLTPKPGCTPDGEGLGCDTLRLRGELHSETLRALEAP